MNGKSFSADKTPEKELGERVTVPFPFMCLEKPVAAKLPGITEAPVSKLPDDFSEMIYCGALFRPGRPRFVLLGLYHSSAAAINPPVSPPHSEAHFNPAPLGAGLKG